MTQVTAKRRVWLHVQTEGMARRIEADPHAVYQGQLPAACLVKVTSSEVVMSWVLPPALTTCWVFTGPVPAAVHTFITAVVMKLPTSTQGIRQLRTARARSP